jgi:chemotaxis protein MotB
MSDPHKTEPYVIKKVKKIHKGGHHGGAWKIAYADFVTAMMAFFLLMWLLALMNKSQLTGFADYFKKPITEAFTRDNHSTGHEKDAAQEKPKPTKDHELKKLDPGQGVGKTTTLSEAQNLKDKLEKDLEKNPILKQYKNLLSFVVTADGLKIVLREMENKPMFSNGKTDFQDYSKAIVGWLSQELNTYPNNLEIIGHTDAAQFHGENGYSNWELSADRANATRRELIKNGMHDDKILRIIGIGDKDLLKKEDGMDPSNRRIEIVVLSDEATKAIVD